MIPKIVDLMTVPMVQVSSSLSTCTLTCSGHTSLRLQDRRHGRSQREGGGRGLPGSRPAPPTPVLQHSERVGRFQDLGGVQDADTVRRLMWIDGVMGPQSFSVVREAFERNYDCLGISCDQVTAS